MKKPTAIAVLSALALSLAGTGMAAAMGGTTEVTIQNTSHVVMTPPLIALSSRELPIFEVGTPASTALEEVAEGGDTTALATLLEDHGARVTRLDTPILPGESVTVTVPGFRRKGFVSAVSMLLPTNDAFVAFKNIPLQRRDTTKAQGQSYDAGTEANDEICASIPGPHCGGVGFDPARSDSVNQVLPHPGIHGEGELSAMLYDWADPVGILTARPLR